ACCGEARKACADRGGHEGRKDPPAQQSSAATVMGSNYRPREAAEVSLSKSTASSVTHRYSGRRSPTKQRASVLEPVAAASLCLVAIVLPCPCLCLRR